MELANALFLVTVQNRPAIAAIRSEVAWRRWCLAGELRPGNTTAVTARKVASNKDELEKRIVTLGDPELKGRHSAKS